MAESHVAPTRSDPLAAVAVGTVIVWVPDNHDKVRQDRAVPSNPGTRLRLHSARNESQYGQIVMRTTTGGVADVSADMTALTGPVGTIPAGSVRIYQQRYIQVTKAQNDRFGIGSYPDALVPLAPGATIPVGPGTNSAFWITVTVPKGQPAGTYSGTVTISGGAGPVAVPVSLTVWNFELPDTPSSVTAFALWYPQIAIAEAVSWGTPAYQSMVDRYYTFQLDHRVVSDNIPIVGDPGPGPGYQPGEGPDPDPDTYLARVGDYLSDPRVSAVRIPAYASGDQNTGITIDTARLGKVVTGLRQKDLLHRTYFYVGDEPQNDTSLHNLIDAYDTLHKLAPEVPAILTLTNPPPQFLLDSVHAWCFEQHLIPLLDEPRAVDTLKARGDLVWFYVCIGDTWPWPGVMIDDSLVGSRVLSWIQHDVGFQGLLYWSTTAFGSYDWSKGLYFPRDTYRIPLSCNVCAGDGFLLYPGKPVGVSGPVGTIRLDAVQGGRQDAEYLHLFEQRSLQIAGQFGVADRFDRRDVLRPYFDVLYTWIDHYQDDPALFEALRAEFGTQLEQLLSGVPSVVVFGKTRAYHVPVTVYVAPGTAVTIAGAASSPVERTAKAEVHHVVLALPQGRQQVTLTVGGDTLIRSVQVGPVGLPHPVRINSFETDAEIARLQTRGTTVTRTTAHASLGASCAQVTYHPGEDFPAVYLRASDVGRRDWSRFDAIVFEAYNDSDQVLNLNAKFHHPSGSDPDDRHPVYLASRTRQTVRIRLGHTDFDLTDVDSLELYTWKRSQDVAVSIDDIRFESTSTVLENPGTWVRADDGGRLSYAVPGTGATITYGTRPGDDPTTSWQQSAVPAAVAGPVASVLDVSGRMNLLGRASNGALVWRRQHDPGGAWQRPAVPDVTLAGPPAAAVDAAGRPTWLARTAQNTLLVGWLDGPDSDTWHTATLTDLGSGAAATVTGDPALALDVSGKLCFFAEAPGNQLLHGWQDKPGESIWHTVVILQNGAAVPVAGRVATSQSSAGKLCFVARDPSGRISHGWQSSPGNGPWQWMTITPVTDVDDDGSPVTCTVVGDPASCLDAGGRLTYAVRTSDGRILHGWQNAPDNGPWHATLLRDAAKVYLKVVGDIALAQDSTGRLVVLGAAGDGTLRQGWQDQPGTGPWHLGTAGSGIE